MSDNFDFGDPFEGDLNFDSDFDSDKKGSKIKSFAIGFLGGAKEALVGDTDAKLRTVKMGLPSSFNGTFQFINDSRALYRDIKEEFKENTAGAFKDIQEMVSGKSDTLKAKLPGGLSNKIDEFSKYDFSQWEKSSYDGDKTPSLGSTSDQDVADTVDATRQSSLLTLTGLKSLGADITSTLMVTGAAATAGNQAVAAGVARSNGYLKQLVEYNVKVQQRNDQMKINLLARMHITNAKFYKFMEAANHRMIKDMREMVKYTKMPDFQKMSITDSVKKQIRGGMFNTVKSGMGGILGLVNDRVGKAARENGYNALGNMTSQLAMVSSMGSGLSADDLIEMLGSMMGGSAMEMLPRLLKGGGNNKLMQKLEKQFPGASKLIRAKYGKIENFGNQLSYGLNNMEGTFNTLSKNYQGGYLFGDDTEEMTYEMYVASLPAGQRPLPKSVWDVKQFGKKGLNKGLGAILNNSTGTNKTQYNLKGRSYADGKEAHIWTNQSDRTLNEIIPAWFSKIHLSLEKARTGNDKLTAQTYDWTRGTFVNAKQAQAAALREVYGANVLGSAAYSAKSAAEIIDHKGELSKAATTEFQYHLAKQSDAGMGLSPYNLLNLEKEGVDPKIAAEIREMTLRNFGVSTEQVDKFTNGNESDRFKLLNSLTGEGAALANKALPFVTDIKRGIQDTSMNIDKLRNSGHYDALRDAGIITVSNGREIINEEKMWKMLRMQLTDDNFDKKLRDASIKNGTVDGDTVNRNGGTINNTTNNNFGELNETIAELNKNIKGVGSTGGGSDISAPMSMLNTQMDTLIGVQNSHTEILTKILEKQPTIVRRSRTEQEEEKKGKKSLMDRIKGFSPRNMFNKGVETLLNNEPLILGGILGGLGAYALHDPKAAALLAAGGATMAIYSKLRNANKTRFAEDGDLYENPGDEEPLLRADRLRNRDYYDSATKKVLETWSDVTSAVVDKAGNIIASARQLGQKLFGPDGRAVMLKGLNKLKAATVKIFNLIDPLGRASKLGDKLKTRFYQLDVFKENEKSPTLIGKKMGKGWYFKLDSNDKTVEIKGWNEIDGPVYDKDGVCIITQDDFDRGLRTSMGVTINKLGDWSKRTGLMGMDLLGKFKDKAQKGLGNAYDKTKNFVKADYSPIVNSVDRIYYLLCSKFGINPTDIPPDGQLAFVNAAAGFVGPLKKEERLNSLADEKAKAKEEKADKVQDAIINIGDSIGGLTGREEKKEKKKGFLGLLMSGFGMVKGFAEQIFGKTLIKGFGHLFTFAKLGIGIIPKIAKGIGNLVSFFTGKETSGIDDIVNASKEDEEGGGGGGDDRSSRSQREERERKKRANRERRERQRQDRLRGGGGTDADLERDLRNQGRRRRVNRRRRTRGLTDRFRQVPKAFGKSAILKAGLLYAGGQAASELMDNEGISTAMNIASGYSLAASAASAFGVNIGVGALAGGAASAIGTGLAALGTGAAALLSSPVTLPLLAIAGIGAAGYGIYKWYTKGKYKQVDVRFAQYGLETPDGNFGKKVFALEQMLTKYVVVTNGSAAFATDTPVEQIFKALQAGEDGAPAASVGDIFSWFTGRFKPVYLTYMSCLDTLKIKSLEEYDKLTDKKAYDIAYQATQALAGLKPFPYAVTPKVDATDKLMGEAETAATVGKYLKELKEYVDKDDKTSKVKDVTLRKVESNDNLAKEKAELQEKLKNTSFFGLDGKTSYLEKKSAESRIGEIDEELGKLNDAYGPGKVAGTVNILDLIPENGVISPFVLVRMNAYGVALTPGKQFGMEVFPAWKFSAIAHLERRVESLIQVYGQDVRFVGKTGELFHEFKAAFRVKDTKANDWCLWFRDRFLPVLMMYVRQYNLFAKGLPKDGWKTLSDTAKYQIALAIADTRFTGPKKRLVSVWDVKTSPFEAGFSVPRTEEVDKLLAALEEISNKAKLRNPVLEAQRTSALQTANTSQAHAVGGAVTDKQAVTNPQTRGDTAMDASYQMAAQNYAAVKGNSNINTVDLSGVKPVSSGPDTSVSVPRQAAEQLIIKEMMANGITDPRAIAEMLALTNYESAGYSRTSENMRYRDPGRLMSLFRNVTDMGTAQQLVQAGPQAIANFVYGGAKGASLGNINPNDGWDFRGRGFVQLTGRANYRRIGKLIGVDLESNPQLASTDPKVMAKIAVAFFKESKQLQSIMQNNNFGYAAKGLNGGNALPGMEKRFSLYKDYLARLSNGSLAPDGKGGEVAPPPGGAVTPTEAGSTGSPAGPTGVPSNSTPPPNETMAEKGRRETEEAMAESGPGPIDYTPTQKPMGNSAVNSNQSTTDTFNRSPNVAGNLPPMSGYGLGGGSPNGGAGAAFDRVGSATSVASGNRTTDYSGLQLKSSETTAGGPVHPAIIRVCKEVQIRVTDFIRFTALNDAYHHKANPRSKHAVGLALDFTVTGGVSSSDSAASIMATIMSEAGMTNADYKVINEYRVKTAAGTGGHIHFNFASDAAADRYIRMVGAGNAADMGRRATEAAMNAPDPASNIPAAPQAQPQASAPQPAPQAASVPAAAPNVPLTRPDVPAAPDLSPEVLASAMKAGSGGVEDLLRQLLEAVKSRNNPTQAVKTS